MHFFSIFLATIFTLVTLNAENLFDTKHDDGKNDYEWLEESTRRWSPYRYWQKLNHTAQTILACGEQGDSFVLPDLIALCEVENDSVMVDLTRRSILRNAGYDYVMTNSPDQRGIDVALLYSPLTFKLKYSRSHRIDPPKNLTPSRDVLEVCGTVANGKDLHIFVVHAPSRRNGKRSAYYRQLVFTRIAEVSDSIRAAEHDAQIVVTGDFNDVTGAPPLQLLEQHELEHVSRNATGKNGARHTYQYRGVWYNFDNVFASHALASRVSDCYVMDAPFLLEEDTKWSGVRPKRNYYAFKWQNGYSDHLPLVTQFVFE